MIPKCGFTLSANPIYNSKYFSVTKTEIKELAELLILVRNLWMKEKLVQIEYSTCPECKDDIDVCSMVFVFVILRFSLKLACAPNERVLR